MCLLPMCQQNVAFLSSNSPICCKCDSRLGGTCVLCTVCKFLLSFGVMMSVFLSRLCACNISETTVSLFHPAYSQQRAQRKAFPTPPPPFNHHQTAPAERLYPANQIPVIHLTTSVSLSARQGV